MRQILELSKDICEQIGSDPAMLLRAFTQAVKLQ